MNALRGSFDIQLADGTEMRCLCNLYAVNRFCEDTGADLADLERHLSKEPLRVMPALLWAAVETAYALEGEEPPMNRTRFEIVLGSTDWPPLVEQIGKALSLGGEAKKKTPARRGRSASKIST